MRRLAEMSGISNPYLSQIENGLRAPSEQVLQGIASSLQTTVDALLGQARPGAEGRAPESAVVVAVRGDAGLTTKQRQALLEVYSAMTAATAERRRNGTKTRTRPDGDAPPEAPEDTSPEDTAPENTAPEDARPESADG